MNNVISTIIYLISLLIFSKEILNVKIKSPILTSTIIIPLIVLSYFWMEFDFVPELTSLYIVYSILILKFLYNISIKTSLLIVIFYFIILSFVDLILSGALLLFSNFNEIKSNYSLLINLVIFLLVIIPVRISEIREFIVGLIKGSREISNKLILLLFMIIASIMLVFFMLSNYLNINHLIISLVIFISLFIHTLALLNEYKEKYILLNKYEELDEYVSNFEDVINKQQMYIHEYKNQLSIIKELTKSKKAQDYIESLVGDLSYSNISNLKELNKLGKNPLRSFLYYKMAIAYKNNIKLELDISKSIKDHFGLLNDNQNRYLLNFLGVFIDNAIEAAKDEYILLEIYEHLEGINIVITNTFKEEINLDKINNKGYSTKGENRGNGLFLVDKINKKYKLFEIKQEIKENLFITYIKIKD